MSGHFWYRMYNSSKNSIIELSFKAESWGTFFFHPNTPIMCQFTV